MDPGRTIRQAVPLLVALALLPLLTIPSGCRSRQSSFDTGRSARAKWGVKRSPFEAKAPRINGASLAGNPGLLVQAMSLTVAQLEAAFETFSFEASVKWVLTRGDRRVTMAERYSLQQGSLHRFHVVVSTIHGQRRESIWDGKALYVQQRNGPFQLVSKEPSVAAAAREKGFGHWKALVEIFGPHLSLRAGGRTTRLGRQVFKYSLVHSSARKRWPKPSVAQRATGQAAAYGRYVGRKSRGLAAGKSRTPLSVEGNLIADRTTGTPISFTLRGQFRIGPPRDGAIATVALESRFTALGNRPTIPKPDPLVDLTLPGTRIDPLLSQDPQVLKRRSGRKSK